MNIKLLLVLLVLGISTSTTIVQAGNFDFSMDVKPAILFLAPGEQGQFKITFTDTSIPPTGGDVTWSVSHDGSHNIYGVLGAPNPVTVLAGGAAVATWDVAAFPDAEPGTIIHVTFKGDPPGIIKEAYANIQITGSTGSVTVRGSSLSIVGLAVLSTFLITISMLVLRKVHK